MARRGGPYVLAWWAAAAQTGMMLAEAQAVVSMRMMGLVGLWPMGRGEHERMLSEKSSAFAASGQAAGRAAMEGKHPHQIVHAAVKPLRKKTRANVKRLSGAAGPRNGKGK